MKHIIDWNGVEIQITNEATDSSYGMPVLVVDGETIMQVPITEDLRKIHRETMRLAAEARAKNWGQSR